MRRTSGNRSRWLASCLAKVSRVFAERGTHRPGVFPADCMPAVVIGILEPHPADIRAVDPEGPFPPVRAPVRAGHLAVGVKSRAVVAQATQLDPVMVDVAPLDREEVEGQVGSGREYA